MHASKCVRVWREVHCAIAILAFADACIRDDVKLAQVVGSILAKTQKIENSNLHGFQLHRPSSKGTKLLLQVIKAIINQGVCALENLSNFGFCSCVEGLCGY